MKFDRLYFILLFLILLVLKLPVLNLPYYWDGLNYVIASADKVYNQGFTIYLWDVGVGHPPFFYILLGYMFKIFGESPLTGNFLTLIFAFLTLYFTYLIGKTLFNRKTGVISSLLLLFYPSFFSYSAIVTLDLPMTAFALMAIYFSITKRKFWYALTGSLLVLTKEIGILIIGSIIIANFLKDRKYFIKNFYIHLIPLFIFALWVISSKIHYGYYFYPENLNALKLNPLKLFLNFLLLLKYTFFDHYKWILTSLLILSGFSIKSEKKSKKILFIAIAFSLLFLFLIFNLNIIKTYTSGFFPNLDSYLSVFKTFSPLFVALLFILILKFNELKKIYLNKNFLEIFISIIIIILFHTLLIPSSPKYIIILYPLTFILFSFALFKIFNNKSFIVVVLIIALFITQWTGNRSSVGFVLEDNLEYIDVIKTHQLASNYIESNFPKATVLAAYPQSIELKYSYGGYVKKPINVVTYSPLPGLNITEYLNLTLRSNQKINISNIDLYYYSPQEYPTQKITDAAKSLNLTLIKRFELNNKSAEIYKVNK